MTKPSTPSDLLACRSSFRRTCFLFVLRCCRAILAPLQQSVVDLLVCLGSLSCFSNQFCSFRSLDGGDLVAEERHRPVSCHSTWYHSANQMCVFWAANTTTVQYRQDLEANDAEKDGRKQKRMIHVGGKKWERYSNEVPILQVSVLLFFFSDNVLLLIPTVLNRYLNFLLLSQQAVCLSYGQTS